MEVAKREVEVVDWRPTLETLNSLSKSALSIAFFFLERLSTTSRGLLSIFEIINKRLDT